jgi:site-specific DNA-adenine methylase
MQRKVTFNACVRTCANYSSIHERLQWVGKRVEETAIPQQDFSYVHDQRQMNPSMRLLE